MLAYHFHWPHAELMRLDHAERRRWVRQAELIADRPEPGGSVPGLAGLGWTGQGWTGQR